MNALKVILIIILFFIGLGAIFLAGYFIAKLIEKIFHIHLNA